MTIARFVRQPLCQPLCFAFGCVIWLLRQAAAQAAPFAYVVNNASSNVSSRPAGNYGYAVTNGTLPPGLALYGALLR